MSFSNSESVIFFKRERTLRTLPWSALLTLALLWPLRQMSLEDLAFGYGMLSVMCLQIVGIFAGRHLSIRRRMGEIEFALPVTLRDVVFGRLAALWATFFGTFVAGSLVWLIAAEPAVAPAVETAGYGWCVARAFAASGVAVLTLGCYRPGRPVLGLVETILLAAASCAVWLSSAYFFAEVPTAFYWIALVAQVAFLWVRVPAAAPSEDPQVERPADSSSGPSSALPVRVFGALHWTILRSTLLRPVVLFNVLMIALYAWWSQMGFMMLTVFLVMLPLNAVRMSLNVLHGVDALPLQRERVLRFAALGSLVIMALGMVAGSRTLQRFHSFQMLSNTVELDLVSERPWGQEHEFFAHVKVPPALWRTGRSSTDTLITAPWGESVSVVPHPLYPGAKTFIYNPYDVGPDSSIRFVAWQLGRALEATYGTAEGVEELVMSQLGSTAENFQVDKIRHQNLDVLNESLQSAGLVTPGSAIAPNQLGFVTALAVLLWLLTIGVVLRPNIPRVSRSHWLGNLPSGAVGSVAAVLLVLLVGGVAIKDRALMPVLMAQTHAWIDARLGSSPAVWAVLIAVLSSTGYAFLSWRIQRNEVPPLAVHGWTKKPMSIY